MSATTVERNTPRRAARELSFPAAAVKILAGTIVVLNASGYAEPATTATGKIALGVAEATIDNSGGAAGDQQVPISRGCFRLANSAAADAIANTDYGATCYLVDNQTVAKTDGSATRSKAGVVRGVDAAGVWVEF
jgi:hypothetical protein